MRRIDRRMRVHGLEGIQQYAAYIQRNNKEVIALFRELLIGVTDFFRDKEAFEILKTKVLPILIGNLQENTPLRIWVPGVATGEEAYSNAIMVLEYMEEHNRDVHVQIFATDINTDAIEIARKGIYPTSIEMHVSMDRLSRFFTREEQGYRIKREVREMVVFSTQNLIKDPPFTKLDLVCCRNLLIYLDSELQKKIIPLFHYSVKPDGVLFLGSSESIGEFTELFNVIDAKWKIFRRKVSSAPQQSALDFALPPRMARSVERETSQNERAVPHWLERQMLDLYAPTSVIVNRQGDILYVHGRTGRYFEPAQGQSKLNAFHMAREGLSAQLPGLVHRASIQKNVVRHAGMRVKADGGIAVVNVTVQPLPGHPHLDGVFMVAFVEEQESKPAKRTQVQNKSRSYVQDLERELESTRENLQTTIEELQTSNEELRSMNEEFQSTNEELQSANEELETSREEMQSLNEELTSVNTELQDKIEDLTRMHEDLQLSLDSMEIPSIFLDSQLRLLRFTIQAQRMVNVLDHDVGRPINHLSNNLRSVDLVAWAKRAVDSRTYQEVEVQANDGSWYLMRLVPYKHGVNKTDGLVITFVDIHGLKAERNALESARSAQTYAQSVIEAVFDMLLIVDEDLRVVSANAEFLRRFNEDIHELIGKNLANVGNGLWNTAPLASILQTALKQGSEFESVSVALSNGDGKILVRSRLLEDVVAENRKKQVLLVLREVSHPSLR